MESKTQILIDCLESKNTKWCLSINSTLESDFDILPQEFLKYAEIDLTLNHDHKFINALSNSKRALDCQLDLLLLSFGFYKISQKKMWGFPTKLDIIEKIGLLAPRILRKINKQRNLLEHQFVKPTQEQVEDMLDISMLFIASTDKFIMKFTPTVKFENEKCGAKYVLNNNYKESRIVVREFSYNDSLRTDLLDNIDSEDIVPKTKNSWKQGDEDYILVLKQYIDLIK